MVVGIFTDTYPPDINGVATASETLGIELEKLGCEVIVVTTNLAGHSKIEREGNVIRIPGIVIKSLYSYRMASPFSVRAYDLLKGVHLDLIHVQTEYGIGMFGRLLARIRGIPLVYTYHNLYRDFTYMISKGNRAVDWALQRFISVFSKNWAEAPAEFTTPSKKTADILRSYGIDRYINVIPNGIDLSMYTPTPELVEKARERRKNMGLEDYEVLSAVGRVGQEKGLDFVLKCLRRYIDETDDERVRLLIVGDGPYAPQISQCIKDLWLDDYVTMTGRIPHDQIPEIYAMSDILITGSKSETQGLTVNEAMASRCLVLAREDLSFADSIVDGETGFYFSDPDTFTEKLKHILGMSEEEREKIRDTAQRRDLDRYSPKRFAEEMMNVYKRALRRYW